jgi:hypothetical protein
MTENQPDIILNTSLRIIMERIWPRFMMSRAYSYEHRRRDRAQELHSSILLPERCPICNQDTDLQIDHDPVTGYWREDICRKCNCIVRDIENGKVDLRMRPYHWAYIVLFQEKPFERVSNYYKEREASYAL